MKKITITKAEILTAVMQEPLLKAGYWVEHWAVRPLERCNVCAVGAVMRRKLPKLKTAGDLYYAIDDVIRKRRDEGYCAISPEHADWQEIAKEQINRGAFLHALSTAFESLYGIAMSESRDGMTEPRLQRVRVQLARFVRAEFPNSFEVES